MKVHRTETGETFEVSVEPSTPVYTLKDALKELAEVEKADDVILICNSLSLNSKDVLGDYGLPQSASSTTTDEKDVFMYSRHTLVSPTPRPTRNAPPTPIKPVRPVEFPSRPVIPAGTAPELAQLMFLKVEINANTFHARTLHDESLQRVQSLERHVVEQTIQARGLEAAVFLMLKYQQLLDQEFDRLDSGYQETKAGNSKLLQEFTQYRDELSKIQLHAAFRTQSRQTLKDCVSDAKLSQLYTECKSLSDHFNEKVEGVRAELTSLNKEVDVEVNREPGVSFDKLQESVRVVRGYMQEMEQWLTEIQQHDAAVNLGVSSSSNSSSADLLAIVEESRRNLDRHNSHILPKMQSYADSIIQQYEDVLARQTALTTHVYARLYHVAQLQSTITDVRKKIAIYNDLMKDQQKQFNQLNQIAQMPKSYKLWLREIVRRRSFKEMYKQEAQRIVGKLSQIRTKESGLREDFNNVYARGLPRELSDGLYDMKFDESLPVVEEEDLDAEEPELTELNRQPSSTDQLDAEEPVIPTKVVKELKQLQEENRRLKQELEETKQTLAQKHKDWSESVDSTTALKHELEDAKEQIAVLQRNLLRATTMTPPTETVTEDESPATSPAQTHRVAPLGMVRQRTPLVVSDTESFQSDIDFEDIEQEIAKQLQEYKEQCEEKDAQIASVKMELARVEQELSDTSEELRQINSNNGDMELRLETARQRAEADEQLRQQLQSTFDKLQKELATVTEGHRLLQGEYRELKLRHEEQLARNAELSTSLEEALRSDEELKTVYKIIPETLLRYYTPSVESSSGSVPMNDDQLTRLMHLCDEVGQALKYKSISFYGAVDSGDLLLFNKVVDRYQHVHYRAIRDSTLIFLNVQDTENVQQMTNNMNRSNVLGKVISISEDIICREPVKEYGLPGGSVYQIVVIDIMKSF